MWKNSDSTKVQWWVVRLHDSPATLENTMSFACLRVQFFENTMSFPCRGHPTPLQPELVTLQLCAQRRSLEELLPVHSFQFGRPNVSSAWKSDKKHWIFDICRRIAESLSKISNYQTCDSGKSLIPAGVSICRRRTRLRILDVSNR